MGKYSLVPEKGNDEGEKEVKGSVKKRLIF